MATTEATQSKFFAQEAGIIPRITDGHANPGPLMTSLHDQIAIAEQHARAFFDTIENHVLSDAGRELHAVKTVKDAETKLNAAAGNVANPSTDHLRQVEKELADVPALMHVEIAREIRDELRKMSASERAARLRDTDDDETISAVIHGPRGMFSLADDATLGRMIARYNAKHRPEQAALAQELRNRIDAVQNFRDMLLRRLKETLR